MFVDEVDIHLNPKIGPDWMLRGQQKTVPTPGQNQKRYLAGAEPSHRTVGLGRGDEQGQRVVHRAGGSSAEGVPPASG